MCVATRLLKNWKMLVEWMLIFFCLVLFFVVSEQQWYGKTFLQNDLSVTLLLLLLYLKCTRCRWNLLQKLNCTETNCEFGVCLFLNKYTRHNPLSFNTPFHKWRVVRTNRTNIHIIIWNKVTRKDFQRISLDSFNLCLTLCDLFLPSRQRILTQSHNMENSLLVLLKIYYFIYSYLLNSAMSLIR